MKKLFMFFFLINGIIAYAQNDTICNTIPYKDKKVCYESVVNVDNVKASVIYSNAKVWVATNFGNANSVIQTDVENTSLVLKGTLVKDEYTYYKFTLTLQFKDGKFKYTLSDLYYHFMSVEKPVEEMPFMKSCIEKTVKEFDGFFRSFISRFEKGIVKDNNW